MDISPAGRAIAEQIIDSARSFGAGLDESIARRGAGGWSPGPLWDQAILSMRTQAGGLAQNLEFLKMLGDDVLKQLPAELSGKLDEQLAAVKKILDEIHTDRGGDFAGHLTQFRNYGDDVATKIKEILAKADEAGASAATEAVEGTQVLQWELVDDVAKETVKETAKAGEQVAKAAGAG